MKDTNVPYGWRLCQQSEVATFYNGRAYKLTEWEDEGTPVIRLQNLTGSGNKYYYSKLELPEHQYVNNGDLLFMWSATFGPKIWKGGKAIYHYHIWKVECKKGFLDQQFMLYNLEFITESMKNKTNGSTMLHFTKKGMEEQLILIPPFSVQQKIAEILSTVDDKIDLIDQKITASQELKTGLMQKLFSEGVGVQDENGNWLPHTEFKDSVYGNIPKKWDSLALNESTNYVDYRGKTPPKVDSGTFLITAKNIKSGFIDYHCSKEYIPSEKYDEIMSRGTPKVGDVLFTTEAPLGNIALVDKENVAIAQRVIKFRPKDKNCLDSKFLKYFMLSPEFQKELIKNGTGSTVLGIKGKRLHVMKIVLPSITEQKRIAETLEMIDDKLDLIQQQKSQTQQLKKGLMQKLLTGEWRVPLGETEAA